MAYYTKPSEKEIQELAGRYELQIFSYEPIEQGLGNSNYLLNTDLGKYILTIFEIEHKRVEYISKLMLLLEKHEYPAPRLKKMPNGEVLTKYHEKSVMIKPYIAGYVDAEIDDEKAKQVGRELAKLHEISVPDYLPDKHPYVEITYPIFLEQEIDPNFKIWVEQRYHHIIEKLPSQLPVGLAHGDLFYDNIIFEDDKFKAIIDLEDVCRIYKIFDLGMTILGVCTEGTEIDSKKAKALVDGYQEIRLLEEIEKDSLQLCIEWAAILTSVWRFLRFKIDMPDAERSDKYMEMVSIAKNTSAIPKDEFKLTVFS